MKNFMLGCILTLFIMLGVGCIYAKNSNQNSNDVDCYIIYQDKHITVYKLIDDSQPGGDAAKWRYIVKGLSPTGISVAISE